MHHFLIFLFIHKQIPLTAVTSVIDGLKKLYIEKLKPLEVTYKFNDFVSPLLVHTCILSFLILLEPPMTAFIFLSIPHNGCYLIHVK
jgi:hypothetical protein